MSTIALWQGQASASGQSSSHTKFVLDGSGAFGYNLAALDMVSAAVSQVAVDQQSRRGDVFYQGTDYITNGINVGGPFAGNTSLTLWGDKWSVLHLGGASAVAHSTLTVGGNGNETLVLDGSLMLQDATTHFNSHVSGSGTITLLSGPSMEPVTTDSFDQVDGSIVIKLTGDMLEETPPWQFHARISGLDNAGIKLDSIGHVAYAIWDGAAMEIFNDHYSVVDTLLLGASSQRQEAGIYNAADGSVHVFDPTATHQMFKSDFVVYHGN